jgi:hypothetical protein
MKKIQKLLDRIQNYDIFIIINVLTKFTKIFS